VFPICIEDVQMNRVVWRASSVRAGAHNLLDKFNEELIIIVQSSVELIYTTVSILDTSTSVYNVLHSSLYQ
jgi:hypothetical protein